MRIALLIFTLAFIITCKNAKESGPIDGKKLFKLNCSLCHGIDGTLQANGSKDLTLSTLTKPERIFMIRKGKGVMTPFENVLTAKEIEAVAEYTLQLKGNQ